MNLKYYCRQPNGFTFLCEIDERTIGRAHVTVEGSIATIADIMVVQTTVRRFWFLPLFKRNLTYRNKGYGTYLLNAVIDKCRTIGLTQIIGDIVGDTVRLKLWYSKNGFIITKNQISMVLDKRI